MNGVVAHNPMTNKQSQIDFATTPLLPLLWLRPPMEVKFMNQEKISLFLLEFGILYFAGPKNRDSSLLPYFHATQIVPCEEIMIAGYFTSLATVITFT